MAFVLAVAYALWPGNRDKFKHAARMPLDDDKSAQRRAAEVSEEQLVATNVEKDEITGTDTTGHEWDGIKELNTPLPRWWLWVLYASIVWAIGYWILMPAWPLVSSYTGGMLGYSQRARVAEQVEQAIAARGVYHEKVSAAALEDIKGDQELLEVALAGGRAAFGDNCAPCHGSGAQGFPGYPNLNDDAWLWGGTLEDIHTTLLYGIRATHDDTRVNDMPAFGADELLSREEIAQVTDYVLSLSGTAPEGADLAAGATLYTDNCEACHGPEGSGIAELGAPKPGGPDLALWRRSGDRARHHHEQPRWGHAGLGRPASARLPSKSSPSTSTPLAAASKRPIFKGSAQD